MTPSSTKHTCVVGLGWGDEGKGKVVDSLSPRFDVVVRYNGGANAGHTVRIGSQTFALHLVPTGVLHEGVVGVIGPGVVVDPAALLGEIDDLRARGVAIGENLKVSDRAHVVMPYHRIEDQLSEEAADEDRRIGTTARGIGPCYADKMRRGSAVRVCDLLQIDALRERLDGIVRSKQRMFGAVYGHDGGLEVRSLWDEVCRWAERIRPFVCDTTEYLLGAIDADRGLLFEGANGILLDVDHGTYPFVTSSSTGPGGVAGGAGVPPDTVQRVVGVTKAYATRVGAGPFVTELTDAVGERIRRKGREYGTTTGRPRRCGWLDAVAARYSVRLTGVDEAAVMHLDTLGGIEKIAICVRYEQDGRPVSGMPADAQQVARIRPVYEDWPGWSGDLGDVTRFEDLPREAARYVLRIEELLGVPVTLVGVGPDRSQMIRRGNDADREA